MARLKVPEPPQHGVSTGGRRYYTRRSGALPITAVRPSSIIPLVGDRASRFYTPAHAPTGRKRKHISSRLARPRERRRRRGGAAY
eukprot:353320-Pleurochrysis_carterae.AAC.2